MGGTETSCQHERGCTSRPQDEDADVFACRPTPPCQTLASRCAWTTSAPTHGEPDGCSGALGFVEFPRIEDQR